MSAAVSVDTDVGVLIRVLVALRAVGLTPLESSTIVWTAPLVLGESHGFQMRRVDAAAMPTRSAPRAVRIPVVTDVVDRVARRNLANGERIDQPVNDPAVEVAIAA